MENLAVLKNRDVLLVLILIVMVFISGMLFLENKEQDDRIKKLEARVENQVEDIELLTNKVKVLEADSEYFDGMIYDIIDVLDDQTNLLNYYMFY
jgi:hypothetical protein